MQPFPPLTIRAQLVRRPNYPRGEHFMFERDGRAGFIAAEDVPAFEGDSAWFVVEQVERSMWPRWKALKPIFPPLWR